MRNRRRDRKTVDDALLLLILRRPRRLRWAGDVSACLFCLSVVVESEKKVEREETRQDFLTNREKKRERKRKKKIKKIKSSQVEAEI